MTLGKPWVDLSAIKKLLIYQQRMSPTIMCKTNKLTCPCDLFIKERVTVSRAPTTTMTTTVNTASINQCVREWITCIPIAWVIISLGVLSCYGYSLESLLGFEKSKFLFVKAIPGTFKTSKCDDTVAALPLLTWSCLKQAN